MLEKELATHSSTLAWKIPQMEERVNDDPICEIAKETDVKNGLLDSGRK